MPEITGSGSWSEIFDWPLIGVHAILTPDGRILSFGTDIQGMQGGQIYYDVWDPVTNTHLTLEHTTETNLFCSAAIIVPETGEILLSGGDSGPTGPVNRGVTDVNIFDYRDNSIEVSEDGEMTYQRWYPSMVTLHSGQVVIFGGKNLEDKGVGTPEIYTPGEGWRPLNGAFDEEVADEWWYPRAWVNSSGKVVMFAVDYTEDTINVQALDPSGTGTLQSMGTVNISTNYLLPAIMFEQDKILLIGDEGEAWVMDISGEQVVLTSTDPIGENRDWSDMTVLADGTVMVSGGSDGDNKLETSYYDVAFWNPDTGEWTRGDDAGLARLYHSTTLLLPDATVLSLGGGAPGPLTNLNGEIFTPYYLLDENGNLRDRPEIQSNPDTVELGTSFTITVDDSSEISKINLVKTGAVTHSLNMDSNLVSLDFSAISATEIQITMPSENSGIQPGHWMLFAIDDAGTPSEAPIIYVPPFTDYYEGDPGILAFRDANYEGMIESFGVGIHEASDGRFEIVGNDAISSLKIPDGYEVYVSANDTSTGTVEKQLFTGDVDLSQSELNDAISYIEVVKVAPPETTLVFDDPTKAQFLTAGPGTTAFVIAGSFKDYGWSETGDQSGVVVWPNGAGRHDILTDFNEIRFDDGIVVIEPTGGFTLTTLEGIGASFSDNPLENQFLRGSDLEDTFFVDGNSADYGWSSIDNDTGIVVWDARPDAGGFDVLFKIEIVQFVDGYVQRDANGDLVFNEGQANPDPIPTAAVDLAGITEDGASKSGNVLSNDSAANAGQLVVSSVAGQAGYVGQTIVLSSGIAVLIAADGAFTIDPASAYQQLALNETAEERVAYEVTETGGGTAQAELIITVTGANDAPIVTVVNGTIAEDEIYSAQLEATDIDGDTALTFAAFGTVPDGLVINPNGTVSYNPNGQFDGLDQGEQATVEFQYTASDATATSLPATGTITIDGKDDPVVPDPVANDDLTDIIEDGAAATGNVLTNDAAGVAGQLSVTSVAGQAANVGQTVELASGVTVTIAANGAYSIDPSSAYQQLSLDETAEERVVYQISEVGGGTALAELIITITGANDAPVVDVVNATIAEDEVYTGQLQATDIDGDLDFTFAPFGVVPDGLIINPDGTVSFDPNGQFDELNQGEQATVQFQYTASDASATSQPATGTITVEGKDDPIVNPIAVDDPVGVVEDGGFVAGNVLTNDSAGNAGQLSVASVAGQANNVGQIIALTSGITVNIAADGSFEVNPGVAYQQLARNETAEERVAYEIAEIGGGTAQAELVITVTGANDAPVVDVVTATIAENEVFQGQLQATDIDGDADLSFAAFGNVPEGLTISPDGTVSYDPNGQFDELNQGEQATVEFQYTASDASATSVPASSTITIEGRDDGPPANLILDDPTVTQYPDGTTANDVFVIAGSFKDYGWEVTDEGSVVVWPHDGGPHDLLYDMEQVRFDDGVVQINSDGTTTLVPSGTGGVTYQDNPNVQQFIEGTDRDDVFVISGNSSDFGWGVIDEGEGVVIWDTRANPNPSDLVFGVEKVSFTDGDLLFENGTLEFVPADDGGVA